MRGPGGHRGITAIAFSQCKTTKRMAVAERAGEHVITLTTISPRRRARPGAPWTRPPTSGPTTNQALNENHPDRPIGAREPGPTSHPPPDLSSNPRPLTHTPHTPTQEYERRLLPRRQVGHRAGRRPTWNVTLPWNWERCKQLACVPAQAAGSDAGAVRQVRFAAHDPGLASCAGEGLFRTFKCAESGVQALPDRSPARQVGRDER